MPTHSIFADYHQFHLFNEAASPAYPEDITEVDLRRWLKAVANLVAMYTDSETEFAITVECGELPPQLDQSERVQIVQGPLDVPSGRIVLARPSSDLARAPRIAVPPGTYRIQVAASSDGKTTQPHYFVSLWPGTASTVEIIKPSVYRAA
jgi:hypothetical protein